MTTPSPRPFPLKFARWGALGLAFTLISLWGVWQALHRCETVCTSEAPLPQGLPLAFSTDAVQQAMALVHQSFVEKPTRPLCDRMIAGALQGMMGALDPYSAYLPPEALQELQDSLNGRFQGVGIEVMPDPQGTLRIVAPIDGTPAALAGLQAQDQITAIDGQPLQDVPPNEALDKLRGQVGTAVRLTIQRRGFSAFDVLVKRQNVQINPVRYARLTSGVGYLRIAYFDHRTLGAVRHALDALGTRGPLPVGLVIDVRNNPGGLMDQAIAVADLFLETGVIVSIQGRPDHAVTTIHVHPKAPAYFHSLPIVVLVNGGAASSSEIFAAALQDNGQAILAGAPTFGKAVVQTLYPLVGGGALRLTVARYATPRGRLIDGRGLMPDVPLPPQRVLKTEEFSILKRQGKNRAGWDTGVDGLLTDSQLFQAQDLVLAMATQNRNRAQKNDTPTETFPASALAHRG